MPLLAALTAEFAMRNYYAHHPWGAVAIIGLGALFSLELLTAPDDAPVSRRLPAGLLLGGRPGAAGLLYCVAWLALDEFNNREFNNLHEIVFEHTPRHGLIVLADNPDAGADAGIEAGQRGA